MALSVGGFSTAAVILSKQILQIEHQLQEMFAFLEPIAACLACLDVTTS